jgi:hypothetical protein
MWMYRPGIPLPPPLAVDSPPLVDAAATRRGRWNGDGAFAIYVDAFNDNTPAADARVGLASGTHPARLAMTPESGRRAALPASGGPMRRPTLVLALALVATLAVAATARLRATSPPAEQVTEAEPQEGLPEEAHPAAAEGGGPAGQPVEVDMQNVDLHLSGGIVLHVRHLRGRFRPRAGNAAPFLDDNDSYSLDIDRADLSMGLASLNRLMNDRVLGRQRSNIKKVTVKAGDEGRLEQKGVMHKGLDLPFKTKSELGTTPDGRIRVHTRSVRILGFLPVKPIMNLFSIEMDDLVKVKPGHGATVKDNDFILDPAAMLPPPRMHGRIRRVWIEGDQVMQAFGAGPYRAMSPAPIGRNHIYWRGGHLRFGKLTMDGTDLELIDLDPDDPFDFSVDHWDDMLVGGFSKNMPNQGLKTYMPDYDDLKAGRRLPKGAHRG